MCYKVAMKMPPPCWEMEFRDRDVWSVSSFWSGLEETSPKMAVARVHDRRWCGHWGFGKQPTRRQIQC